MIDPFYLIVDSVSWLQRLLPCGIRLVQLRIKDQPTNVLRDAIHSAKAICARHGTLLVVNDHWELALECGCDWVHLGQGDLTTADVPALRAAGMKLGISTHDHAELERALALAPDYVALGPIYPTILKKMPFGPQGLARIGEWKARIGAIPLVAIGGITVERAAGVFAAGADTVAVVTDVSLNADPEARTRAWIAARP